MLAGGNGAEEDRRAFKARVEWGCKVVFGDAAEALSTPPSPNGATGSTSNGKKINKCRYLALHLGSQTLHSYLNKKEEKRTVPTSNQTRTVTWTNPSSVEPSYQQVQIQLPPLPPRDGRLLGPPRTQPIRPPLPCRNTPLLFRLFLGVTEHPFFPSVLRASVHPGLYDTWHRADDLEFIITARGWSQAVSFGSFEVYKRRFTQTRAFLESRFEEEVKVGSEVIKAVMETKVQREKEKSKGEHASVDVSL